MTTTKNELYQQGVEPLRTAPRATVLTSRGEEKLRSHLERIRRQLRVEFPARLREARSDGGSDLNDDYLQIKEEEAVVAAAVMRIENLLASAEVVDDGNPSGDVVTIGAVVEVEDLGTGLTHSYELVGEFEEHPGGVSVGSPVGRALIGAAIGIEAGVVLPTGRTRKLKILSLEQPAPA